MLRTVECWGLGRKGRLKGGWQETSGARRGHRAGPSPRIWAPPNHTIHWLRIPAQLIRSTAPSPQIRDLRAQHSFPDWAGKCCET